MEITYVVRAKCNRTAGIDVEFKGISNIDTAFECADNLAVAFPMIDIICEQTGEVVYSHYISTEFFHSSVEQGNAIFKAEYDMCF